jgi:hypothetical protein
MKSLPTMVALLERRIKEKRAILAEYDQQVNEIQSVINYQQNTIEKEISASIHLPDFQEGLIVFLEGMEYKRFYLNKSLNQVRIKQEKCREELREIFEEKKHFEIALQHLEEQAQQKKITLETSEQNDITLTRYVWNKKSSKFSTTFSDGA